MEMVRGFLLIGVFFFFGMWSEAGAKRAKDFGKKQQSQVLNISKKVAKLRGLALKSPVQNGVMSKAQIKARILEILDEQYSQEELNGEILALKRFGLIPEDMDYLKVMVELLEDQIAGFYDPKEEKLYLIEGGMSGGDMVLAHEIDHALQDQHFDLETFLESVKANGDASLARQALVEGDGVALMMEYQMAELGMAPAWGNAFVLDMIQNSLAQSSGSLAKVPLAMREGLIFPYTAGLEFIAYFRKHHPWSHIDKVYGKPPLSTEQILHPKKYERYERPHEIVSSMPRGLSGYSPKVSSVMGEKGIELFLRTHGVSQERAIEAASGWGGDLYEVYAGVKHTGSTPSNTVGIWVSSWDYEVDAIEFFEALEHALPVLAGSKKTLARPGQLFLKMKKKKVLVAERLGARVVILVDIPRSKSIGVLEEVWRGWRVKGRHLKQSYGPRKRP